MYDSLRNWLSSAEACQPSPCQLKRVPTAVRFSGDRKQDNASREPNHPLQARSRSIEACQFTKIVTPGVISERTGNSSDDRDEDFDLLARIGWGDQGAMASLYDRHSTLVYSVALRVCRDSASAEEVLQNIFMQIWLAPQKFASAQGRLDGRLGVLSRDLALDLMRRRKSSEPGEKLSTNRPYDPISHTK